MPRPQVRLAQVRDTPLSVDEVLAAVADPTSGAECVFVGTVRNHDHGRQVSSLTYSAHPTATTALAQACADVAGRHPVQALAVTHRTGPVAIGQPAVVLAVSSGHREQAFAASRDLIDTIKSSVPIWKHQEFTDGTMEWVGLP